MPDDSRRPAESPPRSRAVAATVAVVALVLGIVAVALTHRGGDDSRPGDVPAEALALPVAVNAPGTWSDDEGTDGPVAALGLSMRTVPEGVSGQQQRLEPFGVSAVDGVAAWIDLPGIDLESFGLVGRFALSPDGRWIGWSRHREGRRPGGSSPQVGWAVMNTTTGEVRELADPDAPRVRDAMPDLAFSGDSRYLLTSYETPSSPARRGHQFVAWDVEDGGHAVIEEPGRRWLPNVGSAPTGVVWARGRKVYRYDVPTAARSSRALPHKVVAASWGPDDRAFAYIGAPDGFSGPWRLYAGRTVNQARGSALQLSAEVDPGQVLGWVDERHVVIGHFRSTVHVVDVVTGDAVEQPMAGYGELGGLPLLAADLWQRPLAPAVSPDGTTDPRGPWRWISGGLVALLAGGFLVLWRRRGRQGPADSADPFAATVVHRQDGPGYGQVVAPLRPLATAATGLILVLVDVRIQGFDVVPDPIGWVMAAWALGSVATVHRGFRVAGIAAWLAVIPSLPDWFTGESYLIAISIAVALLVVEFAACTAVMAVSPARAPSASAIRWLALGLSAALPLAIAGASVEPGVGLIALVIILADLAVAVWFLVMLYGVAKESPAMPFPHVSVRTDAGQAH